MIKPPEELWQGADRYGMKLAKALHYMHTGQVATAKAAIVCKIVTNGSLLKKDFPQSIASMFTERGDVKRAKTSLEDQFSYQYGVVEETKASGFWIGWGGSIAMLLAVFPDGADYERRKFIRKVARGGIEKWEPVQD